MFINSLGDNIRGVIKEAGNFVNGLTKPEGTSSRQSSAETESSETYERSDGEDSRETYEKSDGEDSYYQSSDYLPSGEARSNEDSRSTEAPESNGDDSEYEGSNDDVSYQAHEEEDNNEGSGEGQESGSGSNDDYEEPDEDASGDYPTSGRHVGHDATNGDYGEIPLAPSLNDYGSPTLSRRARFQNGVTPEYPVYMGRA